MGSSGSLGPWSCPELLLGRAIPAYKGTLPRSFQVSCFPLADHDARSLSATAFAVRSDLPTTHSDARRAKERAASGPSRGESVPLAPNGRHPAALGFYGNPARQKHGPARTASSELRGAYGESPGDRRRTKREILSVVSLVRDFNVIVDSA